MRNGIHELLTCRRQHPACTLHSPCVLAMRTKVVCISCSRNTNYRVKKKLWQIWIRLNKIAARQQRHWIHVPKRDTYVIAVQLIKFANTWLVFIVALFSAAFDVVAVGVTTRPLPIRISVPFQHRFRLFARTFCGWASLCCIFFFSRIRIECVFISIGIAMFVMCVCVCMQWRATRSDVQHVVKGFHFNRIRTHTHTFGLSYALWAFIE